MRRARAAQSARTALEHAHNTSTLSNALGARSLVVVRSPFGVACLGKVRANSCALGANFRVRPRDKFFRQNSGQLSSTVEVWVWKSWPLEAVASVESEGSSFQVFSRLVVSAGSEAENGTPVIGVGCVRVDRSLDGQLLNECSWILHRSVEGHAVPIRLSS